MSKAVEIANTIRQQIAAGYDRSGMNRGNYLMMCWGARQYAALPEQKIGEKLQLGGLQFRVSGYKHKGLVIVRLMANDTYKVEIGNVVKGSWKAKKTFDEVYCDQLTEIIDDSVENRN